MRNDKRKYRIKEQTKIYILIMKHRSKTTNVIVEVEEPKKTNQRREKTVNLWSTS